MHLIHIIANLVPFNALLDPSEVNDFPVHLISMGHFIPS